MESDEIELQEGGNNPTPMVVVGGMALIVSTILSIRRSDSYDFFHSRPAYLLIINEDPSEKLVYANYSTSFTSREKRDEEWDSLEDRLTKYGHIKFI